MPEPSGRAVEGQGLDLRIGESFDDDTLDAAASVLEHEELNRAMTGESALGETAPSSVHTAIRLLRRTAQSIRERNRAAPTDMKEP